MFDQPEPGKFDLTPELAELARRLAQFSPTPPRIDRDQLMFNAGRAAERASSASRVVPDPVCASPSSRVWPAATATMTAATILLSAMLVWRQPSPPVAHQAAIPPTNKIADPADVLPQHVSTQPWTPQSATGYLGLRNVALARGIGSLAVEFDKDDSAAPLSEPTTSRQLLEELLPGATRRRS